MSTPPLDSAVSVKWIGNVWFGVADGTPLLLDAFCPSPLPPSPLPVINWEPLVETAEWRRGADLEHLALRFFHKRLFS